MKRKLRFDGVAGSNGIAYGMKSSINRLFGTVLLFLVMSGSVFGQINYTNGTAVTQNFNGIGANNSITIPTNWRIGTSTSYRTIINYTAATSGTLSVQVGGNNISNSATYGVYRFNSNNNTSEPSLGGLMTNNASSPKTVSIYTHLRNNGSIATDNFTISYNVEKFRNGSNSSGFTMELFYSTNGTSWTSCGSNFTTNFTADANNDGYTTAPETTVNVSNTFTPPSSIVANGVIYFAWRYSVSGTGSTGSNAQALGLDDVSITPNVSTPTPTLAVSETSITAMDYVLGNGPSTPAKSFTVAGNNLAPSNSGNRYVYIEPTGSDFEFSLDNVTFYTAGEIIPFPTGSGFSATTIYVRLKAGLAVGNYTDVTDITYYNAPVADLVKTLNLSGSVTAPAATITTGTIAGTPFCVTATTGMSVSVPFTSSGTFTANTYTAQLSNASGSFASPVNIGTLISNANAGTITATIPANTPTGTGYRIRVVSNSPAATGTVNGSNQTVNLAANSIAPTATQNILTSTNGSTLTVTEQSTAISRVWKYTTTSGSGYTLFSPTQTGTTYTPNFITAGIYYVVCESTFTSCGMVRSNEVQINVTDPANIVLSSNNPASTTGTIVQSTTNSVIYGFNLAVTTSNATLSSVLFNTAPSGSYNSSDITNFKLWYSTDNTFGSDTLLSTMTTGLGTGDHTFTGLSQVINSGTTGYFFITADIPCAATSGNTIRVTAITTTGLTFVSGNKSGTAFVGGTHTITSALPNDVTSPATSNCQNGGTTVTWVNSNTCDSDQVFVFAKAGAFSGMTPSGNGTAYTANTTFGSGTGFDGGFLVYKGPLATVSVTGLTNGVNYTYKIFNRNDNNWSTGVTTNCTPTVAYCTIPSWNANDSEISNVSLIGEGGASINNTTTGCTNTVQDYTAQNADLHLGGSYNVSVTFDDCNAGNRYDGAGGVWIDWNKDGDFADANETIGKVTVTIANPNGPTQISNFTINIPSGQSLGSYRMRVMQDEGATTSNIDPCTSPGYGAIEDYTITITQPIGPEINIKGNNISIVNNDITPSTTDHTDFGAVAIAGTLTRTFTIESIGTSSVDLTGSPLVSFSGAAGDFSVTTQPSTNSILAGNSTTFVVSFTPTSAGTQSAVLTIANNDITGGENPYTFTIQATGNGSEINVKGNNINIPSGSTAISSTNFTFIGNVNITAPTPATQTFVIENLGNQNLSLGSGVTISGANAADFSITTAPTTPVIGSGTTTFVVTFNPTSIGEKNAVLSIANNDTTGGENPYTFAIQGFGVSFIPCTPGSLGPLEIIAIQDFESSPATPTLTVTNSNGSITGGDAYANSPNQPKFIGARSYQVSNTTGTLNFNFDTSSYQEVELTYRLAAFGSSSSEGLDSGTSDNVRLEISTDNVTWYKQIQVGGFSNARWSFTSGTAVAQATYKEFTGAFNVYSENSPSSGGSRTTDGYSTVKVTSLPIVSTLYVRITVVNNATSETWAIDNITLRGKTQLPALEKTWNGSNWLDSNAAISTAPISSEKAIFNADYDSALNGGSITACACEIKPGVEVTIGNYDADNNIDLRHTMDIQDNIINAGDLIIKNNSSILQHNDAAVNTGKINMFRTAKPMFRYDFTYWSSPVVEDPTTFLIGKNPNNTTIPGLSPNTFFDKYYHWNAAAATPAWVTINYGNSAMAAGKGYIVRAPQTYNVEGNGTPDIFTTKFIGIPNNGIITQNVVGNTTVNKWNLLGNPYPSALNIEEFLTANSSLLEGTVYLWTHNTRILPSQTGSYVYSPNDYASYNFTGSVGTHPANNSNNPDPTNINTTAPDKYIASGQAFFVKGIASGTVTFNNGMREGGTHNSQFFRAPVTTNPIENWDMTGKHRIWLNLTGGTNGFNQTLVGYIQNATNGLDWGFDGDTFGGNIVTLYSIADTKNLVIQGRALPFNNQDQVPLGYKSTINGTLKIAIDHFDGLFEGQDIYLEDLSLNIVHDLKASDYSFTSVAGTFNNRFVLRYVPQETLSNPDHENIANGLILYQNDQTITVKSQLETLEQITVYDLLGRIVFDEKGINQNSFSIQNVVMNEQPLIVKIKLTNGQIVNKKIVY